MENSPQTSSCCCGSATDADENRRGFLAQAIAVVLGAVALLVPAVVGIVAFLNPLRQKGLAGEFMRLTSLDVLPEDGTPRKFPIIADRTDAWNRFPNEPIGAVFLRRTGANEVQAFNVICPHEGCAVQFQASPEGGKFFCPCHAANFSLDGTVLDTPPISPRRLDELAAEIRNGTEVWVKFQNFKWGTSEKEAKA